MSISEIPPGGGPIENPELSLPFSFDFANNDVLLVEQDSDVEIANRIWIVLSYEPGMLNSLPEFGVPRQALKKGGADLVVIQNAISRWVPEANEIIERNPNWFITLVDTIQIRRDESTSA